MGHYYSEMYPEPRDLRGSSQDEPAKTDKAIRDLLKRFANLEKKVKDLEARLLKVRGAK